MRQPGVMRADVVAGITVALILVPQAMAYAELAGLPPVYGLYAAFLPPATAALFGGLNIALASAFGVPALTLPFCAVAAVAHLLPQSVPALVLAAAPHSPERNSSA